MTAANLAWVEVSAYEVLRSNGSPVQVIRAAETICHHCIMAEEQAKIMDPMERKRLRHFDTERQRLEKHRRDQEYLRETEASEIRRMAGEVEQECKRLRRLSSCDTGVNSTSASTMRQHLASAKKSLDHAGKCMCKHKVETGEYESGFNPGH